MMKTMTWTVIEIKAYSHTLSFFISDEQDVLEIHHIQKRQVEPFYVSKKNMKIIWINIIIN